MLFCLAIGGQAASQESNTRLDERINEFDRAARSIGQLERRVGDLELRIKTLEESNESK